MPPQLAFPSFVVLLISVRNPGKAQRNQDHAAADLKLYRHNQGIFLFCLSYHFPSNQNSMGCGPRRLVLSSLNGSLLATILRRREANMPTTIFWPL